MSPKNNRVRINVSKDVHHRLKKHGNSYASRVTTLLAKNITIDFPVKEKRLDFPRPIFISAEAFTKLNELKNSLDCRSVSNVLESILNTDPEVSIKTEYEKKYGSTPVDKTVRLKEVDHNHIIDLGKALNIPQWRVIHELLECWENNHK